jgi:hypothetical protein
MRARTHRVATRRTAGGLDIAQRSARGIAKLQPLIDQISEVAIGVGLSVDDVVHLIRLSFIVTARPSSRLQNGRANISQLAAATGMTRPQVAAAASLLKQCRTGKSPIIRSSSRTIRVARDWHERITRAKRESLWTLPYAGHRSFSEIVKRSAGDIPPRAMLQELTRLGWVRHDETANEVSLLLQLDGSVSDARGT